MWFTGVSWWTISYDIDRNKFSKFYNPLFLLYYPLLPVFLLYNKCYNTLQRAMGIDGSPTAWKLHYTLIHEPSRLENTTHNIQKFLTSCRLPSHFNGDSSSTSRTRLEHPLGGSHVSPLYQYPTIALCTSVST